MEIFIVLLGFLAGLFAWAQIIYPLVIVLPKALTLIEQNKIKRTYLLKVGSPIVIATCILIAGTYVSPLFLVASIPAFIIVLMNIQKVKNSDELYKMYPELFKTVD